MSWDSETIHAAVLRQRKFFRSNQTLDLDWRIEQLKKLRGAIRRFEPEMLAALREDLGRSEAEAYFCGDKSAEEVARLIQSKVTLYINERR